MPHKKNKNPEKPIPATSRRRSARLAAVEALGQLTSLLYLATLFPEVLAQQTYFFALQNISNITGPLYYQLSVATNAQWNDIDLHSTPFLDAASNIASGISCGQPATTDSTAVNYPYNSTPVGSWGPDTTQDPSNGNDNSNSMTSNPNLAVQLYAGENQPSLPLSADFISCVDNEMGAANALWRNQQAVRNRDNLLLPLLVFGIPSLLVTVLLLTLLGVSIRQCVVQARRDQHQRDLERQQERAPLLQQASASREAALERIDQERKAAKKRAEEMPLVISGKMHQRFLDAGIAEKDIPDHFKCPVTGEVMDEPYTLSDTFTYEKSAAIAATRRGKSPKTNRLLANVNKTFNWNLRQAIEDFVVRAEEKQAEAKARPVDEEIQTVQPQTENSTQTEQAYEGSPISYFPSFWARPSLASSPSLLRIRSSSDYSPYQTDIEAEGLDYLWALRDDELRASENSR